MQQIAKWSRGLIGAYYNAVAAGGGCTLPVVTQLPQPAYNRFYAPANVGITVAPTGTGPCAAAVTGAATSAPAVTDPLPFTSTSADAAEVTNADATEDTGADAEVTEDTSADAEVTEDTGADAEAAEVTGAGAKKNRPRRPRRHVVVDTLNILHVLGHRPSAATIVATIDAVAPVLRADAAEGGPAQGGYIGRVMFVVKDRDTERNTEATRALYDDVARRNRVTVYVVEQYKRLPCPAAVDAPGALQAGFRSPRHSARGRDDFYAAILAERWDAPVLTADRFRDFKEWRRTLAPFYVDEYSFSAPPDTPPVRYYVNPNGGAYERMKRPETIRPCQAISSLLARK